MDSYEFELLVFGQSFDEVPGGVLSEHFRLGVDVGVLADFVSGLFVEFDDISCMVYNSDCRCGDDKSLNLVFLTSFQHVFRSIHSRIDYI